MTAPILEIADRLESKGFLKKKGNRWIPQSMGSLTMMPTKDIILRYRTIMAGFLNYYSFVDNRLRLNKIEWILRESLRKTICRKYKMGKRTFLKRFGRDVNLKVTRRDLTQVTLNFAWPELKPNPMLFYGTAKFQDPLDANDWKIAAISALGQPCANCESKRNVEMHHVKHIKSFNVKLSEFDKKLARINRKQVPLCRLCHLKVHAGSYRGISIHHFKYLKWEGEAKWS